MRDLLKYFPMLVADRAKGPALVAPVFRDAQLSWPHAAYADKESGAFDARDRLAAIRLPSLVIAGARDMLPPERVKPLADGIPGAKFVVFERSGHFAPLEEPVGHGRVAGEEAPLGQRAGGDVGDLLPRLLPRDGPGGRAPSARGRLAPGPDRRLVHGGRLPPQRRLLPAPRL